MSWRNRPTHIDYLSSSTDNIAFIDESGTPSLKKVIKSDLQGTTLDENERYFTVTACLIKRTDFEALQDLVMELKFKYWKDALFVYKHRKSEFAFTQGIYVEGKRLLAIILSITLLLFMILVH